MSKTQLLVIGAGPGGYTAAFKAADLGLEVTLVDIKKILGGVCLHEGCIPSKTLLNVAEIINKSKEAKSFGVEFAAPQIQLEKLRDWKNTVISRLTGGLAMLSRQRKITFINGKSRFLSSNQAQIEQSDGQNITIEFEKAILATGSESIPLPSAPDSPHIWNSSEALELTEIPESLLIVGGGYIGLELGTVYANLGTKVSVVEMTGQLLPGVDRDLVTILQKKLSRLFTSIQLESKVTNLAENQSGIEATIQANDGKESKTTFNKVLVAIGRKPILENLGLDKTRIEINEAGFIKVNNSYQTSDPAIYAIGDITPGPMLAHKASHQGRIAVECNSGKPAESADKIVPAAIFTDPQIAVCGLTEQKAKEQNLNVKVIKFPWAASGKALSLNRTEGLTKLIVDGSSEKILGAGIVGHGAGELIAEATLAIEMGATAKDVVDTIHPHPTLTETLLEAAENFYGCSPHIFKPKK